MCGSRLIASVVHQHGVLLVQGHSLTVAVLVLPSTSRNDAPQRTVVVHCRHQTGLQEGFDVLRGGKQLTARCVSHGVQVVGYGLMVKVLTLSEHLTNVGVPSDVK